MLTRARIWWGFRREVRRARRADGQAGAARCDLLLVPCWRRPEFLWHCLDNLTRAAEIDSVHVVFRPDFGFWPENLDVIRAFSDRLASYEIQPATACPFRRTRQSANLLLGYLRAAAVAGRYVFLVEEDVMVARDFLTWHRAVQAAAAGRLFCSIAVRNHNRHVEVAAEADGFYLSSGDYCSYGVCFDRRVLLEHIAPHVTLDYFRRPKRYMRRHFPASRVGLGFVEQDGLIRRIQECSSLAIAYPCLPRAFDAGFYGYNRPGGVTGSAEERRRKLAEVIYDRERLRAAAGPQFADRCDPVDLEPLPWGVPRRIELPAAAP
ncbi:MAG TPA: hypothetical protein VMF64_01470 [Steroidobacteraceae bacterium]|nr:hypothetical protein [Steroidobacteraceae bacterium]